MGKRKRYTEEFKREAVRLVETRGERTIADVAQSLAIAENLLHSWKRAYAETVVAEVRQARGETPEEELKRLRREVAQLKRDKEILKNRLAPAPHLLRQKLPAPTVRKPSGAAVCFLVQVAR